MLSGGVAIISVGAATEIEMKEKKARIEDALHATRAASEEGIVPGGGVALLRAIDKLQDLKVNGDEKVGVSIIIRALEEPLRMIVTNAGQEGSVIVQKIREQKDSLMGYDAEEECMTNMIEAGIIDPTKVTRSALQNAASIASLMLTTEAIICDKPEKDGGMPGGMPGGMGGMGGGMPGMM